MSLKLNEDPIKRVHTLKTLPEYFQATIEGKKTFEIRENDRVFLVGDEVILKEHGPGLQSPRIAGPYVISYIFNGGKFGLDAHYCIFTMNPKEVKSYE